MACTICDVQIEVTGKCQIEATYSDPSGTCCTGESCAETTESGCGAVWTEDATCISGTIDNTCKASGGCCIDVSTCELRNYDDQADCTYLGDETTCAGDPCADPMGECCRGGVCTPTTEGNCADGVWSTGGTCTPNPCPDNPRVPFLF